MRKKWTDRALQKISHDRSTCFPNKPFCQHPPPPGRTIPRKHGRSTLPNVKRINGHSKRTDVAGTCGGPSCPRPQRQGMGGILGCDSSTGTFDGESISRGWGRFQLLSVAATKCWEKVQISGAPENRTSSTAPRVGLKSEDCV